uniref:Uncharacterized protein n=1 Tax=Anguilla anguilla TaxID=7936 RepID=A0A0E9WE41_ANGAN
MRTLKLKQSSQRQDANYTVFNTSTKMTAQMKIDNSLYGFQKTKVTHTNRTDRHGLVSRSKLQSNLPYMQRDPHSFSF